MIKNWLIKNKLLTIIIACTMFLRLFRLGDFAMFLADQGRDARIIRDIVTFTHFPAIGPPSSIGQVFLGPFFYYLVAPFLFIFNFNPVGLAYGVSILSILGIIFAYFIVKKKVDSLTAIIFLIFTSFSSELIHLSRFSWNPNLLPIFSFFTFYFFSEMLEKKSVKKAILFGVFFGCSFQLHHLAALFVLPCLLSYTIFFFKDSNKTKHLITLLFSLLAFGVISFPLFYFDLKHDFLNLKNLISLFKEQNMIAGGSLITRILETNRSLINTVFQSNMNILITSISTTLLLLVFFILQKKLKKPFFLWIHFFNTVSFTYLFSLLSSERHPHYYGAVYTSFFVILAFVVSHLWKKKYIFNKILLTILVIAYLVINARNFYFINGPANNQMAYSKRVADSIKQRMSEKSFNFATYPTDFSSEESFIYYLELDGYKLADRAKGEVSNQMFLVCNKAPCLVIDSPSWNISMFGKTKIDTMWKVEDLQIFKLIHAK